MHDYTQKQTNSLCIWSSGSKYTKDFFSPSLWHVTQWPSARISRTAHKQLWRSAAQREEEEEGREGRRRAGEGEGGRQGWCAVCSAKRDTPATFLNITSLLGEPWLNHLRELQTTQICSNSKPPSGTSLSTQSFGIFTFWKLKFMTQNAKVLAVYLIFSFMRTNSRVGFW